MGGNPLILRRAWLATTNTFIGCRFGNMTITHGTKTKQITLYPPTRLLVELECTQWINEVKNNEFVQPILTIAQAMSLKENTDEILINHCITNPYFL
jgi:hypothetical protein